MLTDDQPRGCTGPAILRFPEVGDPSLPTRRPVVWNPLFLRPGHDMMASRLVCGLRRLAPRQGIASPRRLLCTPAATPPPPPPPLAAEPGMVAHIMKQLGSEVTA